MGFFTLNVQQSSSFVHGSMIYFTSFCLNVNTVILVFIIIQESQGNIRETKERKRLSPHAPQESGAGKEQADHGHEKVTMDTTLWLIVLYMHACS